MSKRNQITSELSSIVRNPKVVIPVIAIMLVPLLYSVLFLGAFWDPYARLDKVPVAIVNEDKGAQFEGETLSIGDEFVDKLKESDDFSWIFVSKEEALKGMEKNRYYMMLEIPEQFSEHAVSLTSDAPQQAQLIYTPNEAYNFLAAQIGDTAVKELASLLNQQITETYVSAIYDKIGNAVEGLETASEGAVQIANGAADARTGADQLVEGQQALGDGLGKLQAGANTLNTAGKQLSAGLAELQGGSNSLNNGLQQINEASEKVNSGAKQLNSQYATLDAGLLQSNEGTTALKQGAMQLQAGLQQLAQQNEQLAASEAFKQLLAGSNALVQGLLDKEHGEAELLAGSQAVAGGLDGLATGTGQLASAVKEAGQGAAKLTNGAESAAAGAEQLSQGLSQLPDSVSQLIEGNHKLENGAKELAGGLMQLEDGSSELAAGLGGADGKALNLTLTEDMKHQFSKPVEVEKDAYTVVPNYGTGFAPYFISLGLYVGCMLLTIVYSMREPALKPKSGASWYAGKTFTVLLVSVLQALILGGAALVLLDLEVANMFAYFGFIVITSVTFMMLIQLLVVTLADAGRFVAIVLLILQLTSSAGTFPLELVPNWLQAVNPFLPMTYSVLGFKQAISSNNMSMYWENVWMLLAFALVCSVITFLYMTISYRRNQRGERGQEGTMIA